MTRIVFVFTFICSVIVPFVALTQESRDKEETVVSMVLKHHHDKRKDCDAHKLGIESNEFIRFGEDIQVVLVHCQVHAYQASWVAYRVEGEATNLYISQIFFPHTLNGQKFTATEWLTTPYWDKDSNLLFSIYKETGAGDCGSSTAYRWDGNTFYLVEARHQLCCVQDDDIKTKPQCKQISDQDPDTEEKWPLVYKYTDKKNGDKKGSEN